jgi:hypothetical protein
MERFAFELLGVKVQVNKADYRVVTSGNLAKTVGAIDWVSKSLSFRNSRSHALKLVWAFISIGAASECVEVPRPHRIEISVTRGRSVLYIEEL